MVLGALLASNIFNFTEYLRDLVVERRRIQPSVRGLRIIGGSMIVFGAVTTGAAFDHVERLAKCAGPWPGRPRRTNVGSARAGRTAAGLMDH